MQPDQREDDGTTSLPPPSNLTEPGEFNKYTTSSRLERWLVDNFMRTLQRSVPRWEPRRILEVGVGEGHVSERVAAEHPGSWLVGLDLPHPELSDRWSRRDVNGVFGDVAELPFEDGAFDLVLAIEVLEHLPDPATALSEIARVAAGMAILSVPLEPLWRLGNMLRGRYLSDWGNTPDHVQHWGRRGFVDLVRTHLEVVEVRQPLPWTMVVARSPSMMRSSAVQSA